MLMVGNLQGAVESVSVGEIKLSLRKSLVKLGVAFISKDPKLLIVISEIEVVTRTPDKTSKTTKSRKPKTSGSKPGKKLMVVANVARFFSLHVRELPDLHHTARYLHALPLRNVPDRYLPTPKASLEIKDLRLDLNKDPGSKPSVYLKLQVLPIIIHLGEAHVSGDNISGFKAGQSLHAGDGSTIQRSPAQFICEEFGLLIEVGPHSEKATAWI
ncbi:hypothetical protein L1887_23996 [Cichorium endivia]|nr:hypothetical protein L1887_23996 [Cichorium endivia]